MLVVVARGASRASCGSSDELLGEARAAGDDAFRLAAFDVIESPDGRDEAPPPAEDARLRRRRPWRARGVRGSRRTSQPADLVGRSTRCARRRPRTRSIASPRPTGAPPRAMRPPRDAFRAGRRVGARAAPPFLEATEQDDPETPYKNIVAAGPARRDAPPRQLTTSARAPRPASRSSSTPAHVPGLLLGHHADLGEGHRRRRVRVPRARRGRREDAAAPLRAAVKLGLPYEELHEESHRQVGAGSSCDVGVDQGHPEEAVVSRGISRAFYPHGLGHSLGLQCHDVGCALVKPKQENPFLRNTSTIARDRSSRSSRASTSSTAAPRALREGGALGRRRLEARRRARAARGRAHRGRPHRRQGRHLAEPHARGPPGGRRRGVKPVLASHDACGQKDGATRFGGGSISRGTWSSSAAASPARASSPRPRASASRRSSSKRRTSPPAPPAARRSSFTAA